jgi:hypothetical protein
LLERLDRVIDDEQVGAPTGKPLVDADGHDLTAVATATPNHFSPARSTMSRQGPPKFRSAKSEEKLTIPIDASG